MLAILLGIIVPSIQHAREEARRTACSDNLRAIGAAILEYHDSFGQLPSLETRDGKVDVVASPLRRILPSLDLSPGIHIPSTIEPYWADNSPDIGKTIIPQFTCPTNTTPKVVPAFGIEPLGLRIGGELATTDYRFSKGPNDSWCVPGSAYKFGPIDDAQLGMFGLNQRTRQSEITDGLGTTIAMGEGAFGTIVSSRPLNPGKPATIDIRLDSFAYWIAPRINTSADRDAHRIVATSLYATTRVEMNAPYVTETLAELAALDDCRPSSEEGLHRVSGFRSVHQAGGMFLFADGSVHFLQQEIDPGLFRAFSTIRGGESIYFGK